MQSGNRTVALEVCPHMACGGILTAWQGKGPELCFRTDLGSNPSSSTAACLTLSTFFNLEERQCLHLQSGRGVTATSKGHCECQGDNVSEACG